MTTELPAVPYFVLNMPGGKAKALFTVPEHVAKALIVHPILCRGAAFQLEIDVVSQGRRRADSSSSSFLSVEFESPDPEEAATQIAQRLSRRIHSPPGPFHPSNVLGF